MKMSHPCSLAVVTNITVASQVNSVCSDGEFMIFGLCQGRLILKTSLTFQTLSTSLEWPT